MTKDELQELANRPLDCGTRANHIWLPLGKMPPRAKTTEEIAEARALSSARKAEKVRARADRLATLYDYYAGLSLSVEEIAAHCGVKPEVAALEIERRRKHLREAP